VLTFLLLNGAAVFVAVCVAVGLGLRGRTSRLALASLAGFLVVVHSVVLVSGLAGRLTAGGMAVGLTVAAAGALALARRATWAHEVAVPAAPFTPATLFAPLAAIAAAVGWAWPHVFAATRLWVWDDYTYHMVYPALWLQERAIAAATPAQAFTMQAWYPLSASLVSAWFMLPFHGVREEALAWVSLTGVLYAGIVWAGAAELLGRLGCRRGAWAVPLVLLATSDRVGIMASSFSDADLAQAAALFGAFAFAVPRGDAESRRDVTIDTCYAALLSGLALGVKVSAAPAALIVLLITALRAAPATNARIRAAARVVLVFALAWAAMAGYWYARNILHTGNPLYPAAFLVWPGATFPETSLLEYARHYGLRRALTDGLTIYMRWPLLNAVLAVAGLVGLSGWLIATRGPATRSRRYFAWGALALAAAVLIPLPAAPYSAGNPMTFRSGFIHWDSMRYVALVPIVGWTALGFLLDAGAGASRWRTVTAAVMAAAVVLTAGSTTAAPGVVLIALAVGAALLARPAAPVVTWTLGTARRRAVGLAVGACLVVGLVVGAHGAKTAATRTALYRDPLFGAAAAVLDREPAGTRVAVFGDQWIYPAFGDRAQLRPIRLDRDGRAAGGPIGAGMEPGEVAVDPATFRANLRVSGIDVVVLVRQPHPGRPADLPTQNAALEAAGHARLLHRDRAVAIWRLSP
jgi:hypothetical protein